MNKKLFLITILIILIIIACIFFLWPKLNQKELPIEENTQTSTSSNEVIVETNNQDIILNCKIGSVILDKNAGKYLQSESCNTKMGAIELDAATGLPKLLINNSNFKSFLENAASNNVLPFSLDTAIDWEFFPLYQTRAEEDSYRWDQSNNPIFFTSDIAKRSYSPDQQWAIELFNDSPDYFVNIFDLKNKCTLRADGCGSLCSFGGDYDGLAWLNKNTFATWGSYLEDAFRAGWFVNVYYIGDFACKNAYMSKIFQAEPRFRIQNKF